MSEPSLEFLRLQSALAGEYSLQRELGRGGNGVVYLASDVQLDRDVAIKVLSAHLAQTAESRERFVREARTAAGLSHPNIVPIHRVGEAGGFVFFVMSYVEGETLGERLRAHGPLSPADAARILREVAWALAYAHGRGVVHCGVKPENILLEKGTGRALVTDFGIAHVGEATGTVLFMSPEQAANQPADGRSDIYSLGVVGYLAVSGRLPFDSPNLPALIARQATQAAPSVMLSAPELPPTLAAAIDRCLEHEPGDRFLDSEALAAALALQTPARPALPPALRAWLGSRNTALPVYAAWSALFSFVSLVLFAEILESGNGNVEVMATTLTVGKALLGTLTLAATPLLPIIGFHLTQARRLFRAGHTLGDLRFALDVASRERSEGEALTVLEGDRLPHRLLRYATYASGAWLTVTSVLVISNVLNDNALLIVSPIISTIILGTLCNALQVQQIPGSVRKTLKAGLRAHLWGSRIGAWIARKLGAPAQSKPIGGGVFRATEVSLGIAASELFAALPAASREQLAELPATVAALEVRAADARAEVELLATLAPSGSAGAQVLDTRRTRAAAHLAEAVAALEGIRLDLLRLHAGASDLAPLTTLIDAARLLGEDVNRLAESHQDATGGSRSRLPGARRVATPV